MVGRARNPDSVDWLWLIEYVPQGVTRFPAFGLTGAPDVHSLGERSENPVPRPWPAGATPRDARLDDLLGGDLARFLGR